MSTLAVAQTQAVDNSTDERSDNVDVQDMDNMETQAVDNIRGQRSDDIEAEDMDNMETQAVGMATTVTDMENAATLPFGSDDIETQVYDQDGSSSDTGLWIMFMQ